MLSAALMPYDDERSALGCETEPLSIFAGPNNDAVHVGIWHILSRLQCSLCPTAERKRNI